MLAINCVKSALMGALSMPVSTEIAVTSSLNGSHISAKE